MSDSQAPHAATVCYHCGLDIPEGVVHQVDILDEPRQLCCAGCEAVAKAIVAAGREDFYRFRTQSSAQGETLVPSFLAELKVYDNEQVQASFVTTPDESGQQLEAALVLEGITCAACVWLNEQHLRSLEGVTHVSVNYSSHRAWVRWDPERIQLSDILLAISQIGYRAHPFDVNHHHAMMETERRQHLRRLGMTGVLTMQVMMLAVALYLGDWLGIAPEFRRLMNWASLVLCLPVLLYGAQPFFSAAWRSLKTFKVNMDVPVALGLLIAFLGSVYHTLKGQGHVYYDSVAMFTFFVLAARFVEINARQKAGEYSDSVLKIVPVSANRLNPDGQIDVVAAVDLSVDDQVVVRPGEAVPADAQIVAGESTVDESLVTGESFPVARKVGDTVMGGSTNVEGVLTLQVLRIGQDSTLSKLSQLAAKAQSERPPSADLAAQVATRFVPGVLFLASLVAAHGLWQGNEDWLSAVIAVLVVTCPCALSLAMPVALTHGVSALMKSGFVIVRGGALETLARCQQIVFDKTGTLTHGHLTVHAETLHSQSVSLDQAKAWVAALEQRSEHPVGRAMVSAYAEHIGQTSISDVVNTPGEGIEGRVEGKPLKVGRPSFVGWPQAAVESGMVYATWGGEPLLSMALTDTLREEAPTVLRALKALGLRLSMFSGDQQKNVDRIAESLSLDQQLGDLRPDDKLNALRRQQAEGQVVAMVGDGINDTPVLNGADVSIAMGSGAQVAMIHADVILLSENLDTLRQGILQARRTRKIIVENVLWAVGYNLLAVPAAALGYVPPWAAAIGMSLSSLIVVLNASRLQKIPH